MARIRTIKPEFPQSESMGDVSREARLTFILLWTLSDDEGRLRGNSRMLASLLFPYDDDAPALIDGWLKELEQQGCVQRYKIDGQSFVQICNWLIHQKIDKPSKSKIPPFEKSREDSRGVVGGSRIKDQGSKEGIKEKDHGREIIVGQTPPDPAPEIFAFWQKVMASPKSVLDKQRRSAIDKALKNYSPAELCKAIRGCSKSPFHMGDNDRKTKYNGLLLVLRSADYIERFIAMDDFEPTAAGETIEQRNARIAAEFVGDGLEDPNIIEMET